MPLPYISLDKSVSVAMFFSIVCMYLGAYYINAKSSAIIYRMFIFKSIRQMVSSRLNFTPGDPSTSQIRKSITQVTMCVQEQGVGRHGCVTQALMELGATVCKDDQPQCSRCPLNTQCLAYTAQQNYLRTSTGTPVSVTDYPVKVKRAAKRQEYWQVCILDIKLTPSKSSQNGSAEDDSGREQQEQSQ